MRKSTIIGAVLVGGIALAGCTPAEYDSDQPPAPGTPPADAPKMAGQASSGEHGASGPAAQLLSNRQQVLSLAQLATTKATSPQAKEVASELQQSATEQISELQQHAGGGAAQSEPADASLSALSGPAFDAQWKQKVLALVDEAANLARSAQSDAQLKELAGEIANEQQEITAKLNSTS
ncbi:DUF305 domain-containing protein [Saccharopolyspora rhizosphaerae]|uniref:DUF305 domain-containing protein n=1 Tax=Saccharopolyspora rhizosphaerae TaxID=2492662 RepID=A0A426JRD0_9PSEU|nr:DUF305 domain-containing protein [Saccharopolyspora rhizosphaerae]RRO15686.1 DUF305 domain-containing protein [Saccharopolyspora rhizosphaerae]